jgi:hypothetical protein
MYLLQSGPHVERFLIDMIKISSTALSLQFQEDNQCDMSGVPNSQMIEQVMQRTLSLSIKILSQQQLNLRYFNIQIG